MRIAFVQTYPVYHDHLTTGQWLGRRNRDLRIPAVVASMGHEVELWVVDRAPAVHGGEGYVIRLFEVSRPGRKTKFHTSDAAIEHARRFRPELCLLKGADGGMGEDLLRRFIKPGGLPYAVILGGKAYTRHVPGASVVMYEADVQRTLLMRPRFPWRRSVPEERLIRLPKTVDTDRFRPMPGTLKAWDVVMVGRLVPRLKNYEALSLLPKDLRVAVVGGGPELASLRRRFPGVTWTGPVDYDDIPAYLNRARLLFHAGVRETYPRVVAEAAACGVPPVAFSSAIGPDVLPESVGLRVNRRSLAPEIRALLADRDRLDMLSRGARDHAERGLCPAALAEPIREMLQRGAPGHATGPGPGPPHTPFVP